MTPALSVIQDSRSPAPSRRYGHWLLALAGMATLASTATRAGAQSDDARRKLMESIEWTPGPMKGELGKIAAVDVPSGCRFTGAEGSKKFMELTENPTS